MGQDYIEIRGAREHNLKEVDVAFHLGDLYEGAGAHRSAAATFGNLASRATEPAVAAALLEEAG